MFCGKCGTKIEEGASFCHNCGTAVERIRTADINNNVIRLLRDKIKKTANLSLIGLIMCVISILAIRLFIAIVVSEEAGGLNSYDAQELYIFLLVFQSLYFIINGVSFIALLKIYKSLHNISDRLEINGDISTVQPYLSNKLNISLIKILRVINVVPFITIFTIPLSIAQVLAFSSAIDLKRFYESDLI